MAGAALGCALGGAALHWFEVHPVFESAEFVVRPVASTAGFYEPALVILGTTVLAAILPAWRATQVDPARVLRGVA